MKRIILFSLTALILIGALAFAATTPGSDGDPLVSLSYVEKRLTGLKSELVALIEASKSSGTSTGAPVPAKVFEVYEYSKGTKLIFGKSAEFILRRGSARVLDPLGNRIPDLTSGVDILVSEQVPLNHLMLVPQADGRGFIVEDDIWVMIKGDFTVVE